MVCQYQTSHEKIGERMKAIISKINRDMIRRAFSLIRSHPAEDSKTGGIAITFDDAYVGEWFSIKELLKSYGARVTFYVSEFNLLTEDLVNKLRILQYEGHEIGFHSLRHLNAVKFVKETSLDQYLAAEIIPGIAIMSEHGFVLSSFSYPYGAHTHQLDKALLKSFNHVRGTAFTNNKKRIVDLDHIYCKNSGKRVLYGAGIDNVYENSVEDVLKGLKRALDRKEVIILYAHKPASETDDYSTPLEKLEAILKYASENGLTFYRISDL